MTAPLVSADVDLRDFAYMPLDVIRLRDSDLAICASAEEFRCAVMLWCASWHQRPAASLPDNDAVLANLAGLGRDAASWSVLKDGALRGWIKCDDGRLYHPVVAEKANEAWAQKLKHRARTEAARAAKLAQKGDSAPPSPETAPVTEIVATPVDPDVTASKGTERNGTDSKKEDRSLRSLVDPEKIRIAELGAEFYTAYPKKTGRDASAKAFLAAVKRGADPEFIVAAATRHAAAWAKACTQKQFIPAPAVWLNKGNFNDEDLPEPVAEPYRGPPGSKPFTLEDAAAAQARRALKAEQARHA